VKMRPTRSRRIVFPPGKHGLTVANVTAEATLLLGCPLKRAMSSRYREDEISDLSRSEVQPSRGVHSVEGNRAVGGSTPAAFYRAA